MRKIIIAVICMLCLAGCAKEAGGDGEWVLSYGGRTNSDEIMYFKRDFSDENGAPYTLCCVDFSTGRQTVVCPKPNCAHNDPDECYALGFGSSGEEVVPYGGRLYWITAEGDSLSFIHSAKADGSGRKKEAELPAHSDGLRPMIAGGRLYVVCTDPPFGENGIPAKKHGSYLYSYDFESGNVEKIADFSEIFPDWEERLGMEFKGFFGGKIWFAGSSDKQNRLAASYDPSSKKLKAEDVFPTQIEGGYMITEENGRAMLTSEDGSKKEFAVAENDIYGYRIVNGMLFTGGGVYDIETGKLYENLVSTVFWGPKVYKDGKYLVYDWFGWTFDWLDEDKVVGKEIGGG